MAHFRLVLYASNLNRIAEKLKDEKEAALLISKKEKPKYGICAKFRHFWIKRLHNCKANINFLRGTFIERFFYRCLKYGSFENYILKSVLGFILGYFLTYLLFFLLVIQLGVNLTISTIICCVIGCILTIGLAFSQKIRCIVCLTLPQFFSKRGRQALIAYALVLTLTGPAKNTLNNLGIMSESLACGQEQLKSAVRQILDVIKKPFVAIKEAIKSVVKTVKEVVRVIKMILIKIKRMIMAILGVIKAVFEFLGRILNICNKELGTPFERCQRVFEGAVSDCQAKLGPYFSWACSVAYLAGSVCYIVKPFDLVCMLVDFISNSIIGVVVRKVKIFVRHIKTMFYVRIKFSHSFHFQSNSSKSLRQVASEIVEEVKDRTRGIFDFFQVFNSVACLFFLFLIVRVIYYRYYFLTKERFDNRFLTKDLAEIDLRRVAMEKETILPLNHRERRRYVTVSSIRLLDKERKEIMEALGFLFSTAMKIAIHMAIDFSIYWIMKLIRKYGKFQSKFQDPNIPTVHIAGEGLLANLLRGVVKSFKPLGVKMEIDTVPCLPTPIPPDFDRYIQIASILLVCLVLILLEPYGLRWRSAILSYYYPRRAKERAVWLYNNILRSRSTFLKFARRQLRRKLLGDKGGKIEKVTCLEYLRSRTNNKCILFFLGSGKKMEACLMCGEVFRNVYDEKMMRCQRPNCGAIYCVTCFNDLENLCTVCLSPIEYGDLSDFSEEKDSSDEEILVEKMKSFEEFDDDDEDGDSGNSSDGDYDGSSSTEYSYSYQDEEKKTSKTSQFSEGKQRSSSSFLELSSMQIFDDEIELRVISSSGENSERKKSATEASSLQSSSEGSSFEIVEKKSSENSTASSHSSSEFSSSFEMVEKEGTATPTLQSSSEASSFEMVKKMAEESEDLIEFLSEDEKEVDGSNSFSSVKSSASDKSYTSVKEHSSHLSTGGKISARSGGKSRSMSDSEISEKSVQALIGRRQEDGTSTILSPTISESENSPPNSVQSHIEFVGLQEEKLASSAYKSTISTNTMSSSENLKSVMKIENERRPRAEYLKSDSTISRLTPNHLHHYSQGRSESESAKSPFSKTSTYIKSGSYSDYDILSNFASTPTGNFDEKSSGSSTCLISISSASNGQQFSSMSKETAIQTSTKNDENEKGSVNNSDQFFSTENFEESSDGSSDISLSVKENILGTPVPLKKTATSKKSISKEVENFQTPVGKPIPRGSIPEKAVESRRSSVEKSPTSEPRKSFAKDSTEPTSPRKSVTEDGTSPRRALSYGSAETSFPEGSILYGNGGSHEIPASPRAPGTHRKSDFHRGSAEHRAIGKSEKISNNCTCCHCAATQTNIRKSDRSCQIDIQSAQSTQKCALIHPKFNQKYAECDCELCTKLSSNCFVENRRIKQKQTTGVFCRPKMKNQSCVTCQEEINCCCNTEEKYPVRELGLAYQENDEYKRLVRELEEKLVLRNRERVRRTMREFEKCSLRNQNLRRPILYEDSSSCGEEPILNQLVNLKKGEACCCKPQSVKGTNTQKSSYFEEPEGNVPSSAYCCTRTFRENPSPRSRTRSRWQIDKRTGEWFRVSNVDLCNPYEGNGRFIQTQMMNEMDENSCDDCEELNRNFGYRDYVLFCPRHKKNKCRKY